MDKAFLSLLLRYLNEEIDEDDFSILLDKAILKERAA